uniref:Inner centromere protein ARK-binding domain-containing protein n=1 Tax=Kalanchoe fedtschenkoi TaxID=63787 RepID=A0A7N0U1W1_KALFE
MSAPIEKLIAQIFHRKDSIIEQVRHQVELYDQQLASKLVIQGIEPPPWLWNHQPPSHSSEINKQKLISELLLPHPQQAVPYFNDFHYSNISAPACHFDHLDEPLGTICFDDVGYVPDISVEVQTADSSPQQQTATRLDCELDLSCTEFKRSKSRQRALELRSSVKSGSKQHAQEEKISVIPSWDSTLCKIDVPNSNHVEKPESGEYSDILHYDGDESEGIMMRFSDDNNSGGSLPIQHLNHGDRVCKGNTSGAEPSGQINKPTESTDILCTQREGNDVPEGINIQSCKGNRISVPESSQRFEHVCGSIDHVPKSKSVGALCSGHMNKSTQFEGSLIIDIGDVKPEDLNVQCFKGNNNSEEVPIEAKHSQQFLHEFDSAELDICCVGKTIGAVSGGHMDDNVTESLEMVSTSAVACGYSSTDAAVTIDDLSNAKRKAKSPSRTTWSGNSCQKLSDGVSALHAANLDGEIGSAFSSESLHDPTHAFELPVLQRAFSISGKSSGLKEERPEDHMSNEKVLGDFSGSPTKSESSMQKYSELVQIVSDDKEGDISRETSLCKSLQNHDHVVESMRPVTPSDIIAITEKGEKEFSGKRNRSKSSAMTYSELHSLSSLPKGTTSLLEADELKVLITEAEVPLLQSATVRKRYLQMEEASSSLKVEQFDPKNMKDGYAKKPHSPSGEKGWRIVQEKHGTLVEPATISLIRSSVEIINPAACDYSLVNDDVHDQATKFGLQSQYSKMTSPILKDSSNMQVAKDHVGIEKMEKTEATASQVKATSFSIRRTLGKGETEDSLRYSIQEAEQPTDNSMMGETRSKCFLEGGNLFSDMEAKLNKEHHKHETLSTGSTLERESYAAGVREKGFVDARCIDMMGNDQSMPVLEGFIVDTCDGEPAFAGGETVYEESCHQSCSSSWSSILERLCHSASRNDPMSNFPMTYRLHKTSDLYQSVPNGLLEHMPMVNDYSNKKLKQKSYSEGQHVSTDPFNISVSTPYASPVRKKWDRSALSSGLRGQGSLNSNLGCFTIEEDPGNCDGIGNREENAEAPLSHAPCLKSSSKRNRPSDITENFQNPPLSVSANENFMFTSHKDSAGMEFNLNGALSQLKQMDGKKISNKKRRINDVKVNSKFSEGEKIGKRVTDSQKKSKSQKHEHLENPNTMMGISYEQKVLRSNNIVSNISSFIPLVQQKKAATNVTGKRDVKVRALGAAEAAKRLEEKKENERKMKKEAWKAEKARLEKENLLQQELKKKKKEEEQKKKEAEMAAKKRHREEEEKKEKLGKRRRIEEARKQQHEQGKKQGDDNLKKEIRHQAAGVKVLPNREPSSELEQYKKIDMGGGKCKVPTDFEDKSRTLLNDPKTMLCDPNGCNFLVKACKTVGGDGSLNMVMSGMNAIAERNLKVEAEGQQSYEISPYQVSDDEDEEDDNDRRKWKLVPAWASKNNLAEAAIFTEQHMDPYEILVPVSFCSIDEGLHFPY